MYNESMLNMPDTGQSLLVTGQRNQPLNADAELQEHKRDS
jgi:hypothetical protein